MDCGIVSVVMNKLLRCKVVLLRVKVDVMFERVMKLSVKYVFEYVELCCLKICVLLVLCWEEWL